MQIEYSAAKANLVKAFESNGVNGATDYAASLQDADLGRSLLNDLVHSAINANLFSEAEQLIQFMDASYEKADAARATAKRLLAKGLVSKARTMIELANSIPEDLDVLPDKADDTYQLSQLFRSLKDEDRAQTLMREAVEIARRGEDALSTQYSLDSSRVLGQIANDLSASGDHNMAMDVASAIKHELVRERTIRQLSQEK